MGRGLSPEEILVRGRGRWTSHCGPVPARKSMCLMRVQVLRKPAFVTNESLDLLKSPLRWFAEVGASTNWVSLKQGFFFFFSCIFIGSKIETNSMIQGKGKKA